MVRCMRRLPKRSVSRPSTTDSNSTDAVYKATPTPVRIRTIVNTRNPVEGSAGISRNPTVEMVVTVW